MFAAHLLLNQHGAIASIMESEAKMDASNHVEKSSPPKETQPEIIQSIQEAHKSKFMDVQTMEKLVDPETTPAPEPQHPKRILRPL